MAVTLDVDARDVSVVRTAFPEPPRAAIVLGSGLSAVADGLSGVVQVPFADLPGAPRVPGVVGQAGTLAFGYAADVPVLAFRGRFHCYQGLSALEAAWPTRLAAAAGASALVVTNAAGALDPAFGRGEFVVISDHVNLLGDNPLRGWPGPEGGNPFVPMRDAYDPALRELARRVAEERGRTVREGVYVAVPGPTYETPAEVAYLRSIGADLVGMSTVPEVIAARALGLRVLGVSLVTNVAAAHDLDHAEVLETGAAAERELSAVLLGILSRL